MVPNPLLHLIKHFDGIYLILGLGSLIGTNVRIFICQGGENTLTELHREKYMDAVFISHPFWHLI